MPPHPGFDLLAISDRRFAPGGTLEPWLASLAAAGIGAVQLREKDLSDRALYELAAAARRLLPPDTDLLVNGRADVALAAAAQGGAADAGGSRIGVHLPAAGMPVAPLRARFGPGLLIGCSTHSFGEVERARDAGADFATFGPVYATPSKAAYGDPVGLSALERAAALGLPLYALGGVTLERLPELARAGAAGAAGIRIFFDPDALPEIAAAARRHFSSRSSSNSRSASSPSNDDATRLEA